jgi:thiamine biosynthesis lipoprotein
VRQLDNLLVLALACVQCAASPAAEYRASSYVFGTLAQITVFGDDPTALQRAAAGVFREFDRMHRDLHAWQPGELMALNEAIARGEKDIATTAEIAALIANARRFSERSGDLFNPAIGKLVALWSFQRDRPGGPVPEPSEIARLARARPRMEDLTVLGNRVTSSNPEVRIDFGGYAKGYALDRAADILRDAGTRNALVNVGGNILALGRRGDTPWRVGLEDPRGPAGEAHLLGTIELADGEAIGTSGDYRRYYVVDGKRYAHNRPAQRLSGNGGSLGDGSCLAAPRRRRAIGRRKQAALHRRSFRLERSGGEAGHHPGAARGRRGSPARDAGIGAAAAGTRRRGAASHGSYSRWWLEKRGTSARRALS